MQFNQAPNAASSSAAFKLSHCHSCHSLLPPHKKQRRILKNISVHTSVARGRCNSSNDAEEHYNWEFSAGFSSSAAVMEWCATVSVSVPDCGSLLRLPQPQSPPNLQDLELRHANYIRNEKFGARHTICIIPWVNWVMKQHRHNVLFNHTEFKPIKRLSTQHHKPITQPYLRCFGGSVTFWVNSVIEQVH